MAQGSSNPIFRTGVLDPGNSSTVALAASGVFTGTAFDVTGFASINVNVFANVDSATSGLAVQFSTDGTNWDHSHSTTYTAGTGKGYIFNAEYRYARVVYTNGGTLQTTFRLQTIFKTTAVPSSLFTLNQTIPETVFAPLNRSAIIGKNTGGGATYVDVKVNPSGALTVDATPSLGTAGTRWYVQISDGTNSPSIKAASTAAVAADPSLVVALSPNTALPTGTNTIGSISNISGTISLPTGAATSANQTTQITALQILDDAVVVDNAAFTDGTTRVSMAGFIYDEVAGTALTENDAAAGRINANRAIVQTIEDGVTRGRYATVTAANAVKVDGSAVTQPVSGTFWQATQPVSLASVPSHPVTNAGTFAVQVSSALPAGTNAIGSITNTSFASTQSGTWTVQPGNTANTTPWLTRLSDGTNSVAIKAASTAAAATDPALVVAISPNNSVAVTGTFWQATQPVSGTVTANAGTGSFTVAQAIAGNLNATVSIAAAQTLATVTTVSTVTNLSQLGGTAIAMNTGVRSTGTQRVTVATDDVVQVKALPDATATYAPTSATTTAYAASIVAKASPGTLYQINGFSSRTSAQFIQVHNSATAPSPSATPALIFYVPANSNFSLDLGTYGRFFSTGIVVCNSTVGPSLTAGSADCWFDVLYK